jgi:TatD DNase family protein
LKFIDSHAHLSSDQVYDDINGIIERAKVNGIEAIVNICTDTATLERGLVLAKNYGWIHPVAATTPHDVSKEGESFFPIVTKHAKEGKLIAIGETGLDYYYEHSPMELQKDFLRRYLHLALECGLPVVIHCREAFSDFFSILDAEYQVNGKHAPGVLHCFTGSLKEAEEVLKRNWYLSLSGIVTFKKSAVLKEVAKMVPLDQLLIETDTPYLAPQSRRGKTNEPSYLPEIAAVIAETKGIAPEEVAVATTANAKKLFKLPSFGD